MSNKFNTLDKMLERFSFNHLEREILKYLKSGQAKTVKEICEALKVKRLTLLYNLKKLEERGFVKVEKRTRTHTYSANLSAFGSQNTLNISSIEAYKMLSKSKARKLYAIQGAGAIKNLLTQMKADARVFESSHRLQKLRQVIIETVVSRDSLKLVKLLPTYLKKSHTGRPMAVYVTKQKLDFNYEVISDQTSAYIIDTKNETAIIIKSVEVASVFIAMFEMMQAGCEKASTVGLY